MPDYLRWIEALEAKTVANGCTPEEAAAAQVKAQELRAKHHIYRPIRPRVWMETWHVTYDGVVRTRSQVRDLYTPEVPWYER